ncbi:hypothetical protein K538_03475 [Agrobacterium tumefaciens GW4]|nr:hypothetical protein K538_03475 [Agrobacterium tumefaciens GW4]
MANIEPDSDGYLWLKVDKVHEGLPGMTPEEALVMAATQGAPLASTFVDAVCAPACKRKPSWYQISSDDRMIAPEIRWQCRHV